MSKEKKQELIFKPVDSIQFDLLLKRVIPFLDKYNNDQAISSRISSYPMHKVFNLKQLCLSCYTQGLVDAQQLKEHI